MFFYLVEEVCLGWCYCFIQANWSVVGSSGGGHGDLALYQCLQIGVEIFADGVEEGLVLVCGESKSAAGIGMGAV